MRTLGTAIETALKEENIIMRYQMLIGRENIRDFRQLTKGNLWKLTNFGQIGGGKIYSHIPDLCTIRTAGRLTP